jgi:hypothetical protein
MTAASGSRSYRRCPGSRRHGHDGEDRICLLANPHAHELGRQVGEITHFDAGDIAEIAGVVAIAADAVSFRSDSVEEALAGVDGSAATGRECWRRCRG